MEEAFLRFKRATGADRNRNASDGWREVNYLYENLSHEDSIPEDVKHKGTHAMVQFIAEKGLEKKPPTPSKKHRIIEPLMMSGSGHTVRETASISPGVGIDGLYERWSSQGEEAELIDGGDGEPSSNSSSRRPPTRPNTARARSRRSHALSRSMSVVPFPGVRFHNLSSLSLSTSAGQIASESSVDTAMKRNPKPAHQGSSTAAKTHHRASNSGPLPPLRADQPIARRHTATEELYATIPDFAGTREAEKKEKKTNKKKKSKRSPPHKASPSPSSSLIKTSSPAPVALERPVCPLGSQCLSTDPRHFMELEHSGHNVPHHQPSTPGGMDDGSTPPDAHHHGIHRAQQSAVFGLHSAGPSRSSSRRAAAPRPTRVSHAQCSGEPHHATHRRTGSSKIRRRSNLVEYEQAHNPMLLRIGGFEDVMLRVQSEESVSKRRVVVLAPLSAELDGVHVDSWFVQTHLVVVEAGPQEWWDPLALALPFTTLNGMKGSFRRLQEPPYHELHFTKHLHPGSSPCIQKVMVVRMGMMRVAGACDEDGGPLDLALALISEPLSTVGCVGRHAAKLDDPWARALAYRTSISSTGHRRVASADSAQVTRYRSTQHVPTPSNNEDASPPPRQGQEHPTPVVKASDARGTGCRDDARSEECATSDGPCGGDGPRATHHGVSTPLVGSTDARKPYRVVLGTELHRAVSTTRLSVRMLARKPRTMVHGDNPIQQDKSSTRASPVQSTRATSKGPTSIKEKLQHPSAKQLRITMANFVQWFVKHGRKESTPAELVYAFLDRMEQSLEAHPLWEGLPPFEMRNSKRELQAYLFDALHPHIFTTPETTKKDSAIHRRIQSFAFIEPKHLEIPDKLCHQELWQKAGEELCEMNAFHRPEEKLMSIMNCCRVLIYLLQSCGNPAGADDFVPQLVYTILRSNPPQLHSNLQYVSKYCNPDLMVMENVCFFTHMLFAVSFIDVIDASSLKIDPDEFDREWKERQALIKKQRRLTRMF